MGPIVQRYYDPIIGRFLSVDAVTADGNTGSNFNRYWYANNNPYRFTDPDGRLACQDCDDAFAGTAVFAGGQAVDSGAERGRYSAEAARLSPGDSAGRSALKSESRARTPSMVRAGVNAARPSTAAKPGSGGRANASNASANAAGNAMKVGGRLLVAGAVAQQANEIANSADPARDVAGAGGMTLGAIGGGEAGVAIGATLGGLVGGPPGAAVGAVLGGLTGAGGGGVIGEKAAEAVYDKSRER
ncbi:MAG: hypothetical protein M3414_08355 [Pseudomonadota bacterium]|nr:hypothetical protein [Pseudomonadota bacterium]